MERSEIRGQLHVRSRIALRSIRATRPFLRQHLEHQLHRHQHRIVATQQPALGEAAGVVDQCDVQPRFKRAAGIGCDGARS